MPTPNSSRTGRGGQTFPARLREGSETCRAEGELVAAGWAAVGMRVAAKSWDVSNSNFLDFDQSNDKVDPSNGIEGNF